jgi:hypothetical protein
VDFGGATLAKPVAAQFAFDGQGYGGSPALIGLFVQHGQTWQYVRTTVDSQSGFVDANLDGSGDYLVAVNTTTFNDIPQGYWAATALSLLLGRDAISGYADGGFHPDATVTRAEFVKRLVLALGLPVPESPTADGFTDVDPAAWYAPYVDAAVSAGLVEGVTSTAFEPDALITREQITVMAARAMNGYTPSNPLQVQFCDQAKIASWALPYVMQAVAAGIVHGLTSGAFDPNGDATRAQAAQLIANLVTVTNQ